MLRGQKDDEVAYSVALEAKEAFAHVLYISLDKVPLSGQKDTPLIIEKHIQIVHHIQTEMRLLPRIAEMKKLKEMNREVPSNFTLKMYMECDNETGFIHSVTQWDPPAQLEPMERDTLKHFLQLPLLRLFFYLYQYLFTFKISCLPLSISVYLLSIFVNFNLPLSISVYLFISYLS